MEGFILVIVLTIAAIVWYSTRNDPHDQIILEQLRNQVLCFNDNLEKAKSCYIRHSQMRDLHEKFSDLYKQIRNTKRCRKMEFAIQFMETYSAMAERVKDWNSNFVEKELKALEQYFSDVDRKSLDIQQRRAVVVDEDSNLVLAGAGSGKTLTISAKVKYLVEMRGIDPEDILLLSFTKKAAEEMQTRIVGRLDISARASTFHKLGLDIISHVSKFRPDVFDDMPRLLNEYFEKTVEANAERAKQLVTFFGVYFNVPQDPETFEKLGEMYEERRHLDLTSLKARCDERIVELRGDKLSIKGEHLKSLEEVIIANYLFLHGVAYTYEKEYPFTPPDPFHKRYRPDFYLDDYDLYLEHFGITKDNKVPWLSEIEEKKYLESIQWKRSLHQSNETTLLETYSYYNKEGTLLKRLDELLKSKGVKYVEADFEQVYKIVFRDRKDRFLSEFKTLVETFIGLFKSRGFSDDDFGRLFAQAQKGTNPFMRERAALFLSIVQPIYRFYQDTLKQKGQIDFNDMINQATDCVTSGKYKSRFKYILIDEYQDISYSRFMLVKALRDQNNAQIMAVGDDWQSIFRFAGSDISLFTRFEQNLGASEVLKIERTYRNSQELISLAGSFIKKNPAQLGKDLVASQSIGNPVMIMGYTKDQESALDMSIKSIVSHHGSDAEIMILGRHNFDIEFLNGSTNYSVIQTPVSVFVESKLFPAAKITFSTVHKAKGREADNIIVINMENRLLGFPNQKTDDPILALVLTNPDNFPYSEERRLFYVALTRTKNRVYLLVPDRTRSVFITELIEHLKVNWTNATGEASIQSYPKCPRCQTGHLVIRESESRQFLGCSNYPQCDKSIKQIEILTDTIICSKCGGYMVKHSGTYGQFYGCLNYPLCGNKINIVSNLNDRGKLRTFY